MKRPKRKQFYYHFTLLPSDMNFQRILMVKVILAKFLSQYRWSFENILIFLSLLYIFEPLSYEMKKDRFQCQNEKVRTKIA